MKDESHLIDAALKGDSQAFGELVRKYQDRLYTSIVHVVGCQDEAEDVVQDAFVQVYLKLDSFQRSSAFFTWLYRIAFNVAISRKRRRRAEMSVDEASEQGGEPESDDEHPGERLLREERVNQVQAALKTLSEEHRAVMVLREIEGCDYETVAEILEISIGTVRSRLHRARSQMRNQLKAAQQGHASE